MFWPGSAPYLQATAAGEAGAKEGHSHSHLIPSASMGERGTPGPHSE